MGGVSHDLPRVARALSSIVDAQDSVYFPTLWINTTLQTRKCGERLLSEVRKILRQSVISRVEFERRKMADRTGLYDNLGLLASQSRLGDVVCHQDALLLSCFQQGNVSRNGYDLTPIACLCCSC